MIVGFLFLSAFVQVYWLFRLMKKSDEYETRIKALEARKPEPEKRVQAPVIPAQVFLQQIENFTPKKPATLRPNQVRGRDIQGVENVIEFDVKIKG